MCHYYPAFQSCPFKNLYNLYIIQSITFLYSQHFIKFAHIYILLIFSFILYLPLGFEDILWEGLPLLSQTQKEITDVIIFIVLWEQTLRQCT